MTEYEIVLGLVTFTLFDHTNVSRAASAAHSGIPVGVCDGVHVNGERQASMGTMMMNLLDSNDVVCVIMRQRHVVGSRRPLPKTH